MTVAPLKKEFESCSFESLWQDIGAGISVALLTIPQAVAYALVAELPVSCGLFAAIFSSMVAAILGSSRCMISGPSNTLAILIQATIAQILARLAPDLQGVEKERLAIEIVVQLSLAVGCIQLLCAALRLGKLITLFGDSVIFGYLVGAIVAIAISQTFIFLGIPKPNTTGSFYQKGVYLIIHLSQFHGPTALMGLASLLLLIFFRRLNQRLPAALFVCSLASAFVYTMDLSSSGIGGGNLAISVVSFSEQVNTPLSTFALPSFNGEILAELLSVAPAVALLGMIASLSVSQAMAKTTGKSISVNQEIFSLGIANLISSFVFAMPISGIFSRTMLNYQAGAKTRLAAIFCASFVALLFFVFTPFIQYIPNASLSALLLLVAFKTLTMKSVRSCFQKTGYEALIFWTTLCCCIFFSLDIGLYAGLVLSLIHRIASRATQRLVLLKQS